MPRGKPQVKVWGSIYPEMLEAMETLAKAEGVRTPEIIRRAITQYLANQGKNGQDAEAQL